MSLTSTDDNRESVEHRACRGRTAAEDAVLHDGVDWNRAGDIARAFHEARVRLRPEYVGDAAGEHPWNELPLNERALLVSVFSELIPLIEAPLRHELGAHPR